LLRQRQPARSRRNQRAPLFLSSKEAWQVSLLAESYTLEQIQRWTLEPSVLIDADNGEVLPINRLYPWTEPAA